MFAMRDIELGFAFPSSFELATPFKRIIHCIAAAANHWRSSFPGKKGTCAPEFAVPYILL
jgi:hypothetical protein